jgi:hypothetical protein
MRSDYRVSVLVTATDTILPKSSFYFAMTERDQRHDAKYFSLATALSERGTELPEDSTYYILKHKGREYYVNPHNKESFFYISNYVYNDSHTAYYFYLREYLEKLEARE